MDNGEGTNFILGWRDLGSQDSRLSLRGGARVKTRRKAGALRRPGEDVPGLFWGGGRWFVPAESVGDPVDL